MSENNSLEVLRALVEKDPRASDQKILDRFRGKISGQVLSASRRDAQAQIILDLIRMLKAERRDAPLIG